MADSPFGVKLKKVVRPPGAAEQNRDAGATTLASVHAPSSTSGAEASSGHSQTAQEPVGSMPELNDEAKLSMGKPSADNASPPASADVRTESVAPAEPHDTELAAPEAPPPSERKSFLGSLLSSKRASSSAPVAERPMASLLSSGSSKIDPTAEAPESASASPSEGLDEKWTAVEPSAPPPSERSSFLGGMLSRKRGSSSVPVDEKPRTSLLSRGSVSSKIDPTADAPEMAASDASKVHEDWTAVEPPMSSRKSTSEQPVVNKSCAESLLSARVLDGRRSRKTEPIVKVFSAATLDPAMAGTASGKAEDFGKDNDSSRPASDPFVDATDAISAGHPETGKTRLVGDVSSNEAGKVKPSHRRDLRCLAAATIVGLIILAICATTAESEHPGQPNTLPGAAAGISGGSGAAGLEPQLILVQSVTVEATLESFDQKAYVAHLVSALPGISASVSYFAGLNPCTQCCVASAFRQLTHHPPR